MHSTADIRSDGAQRAPDGSRPTERLGREPEKENLRTDSEHLRFEAEDSIGVVTLNRPNKRNALLLELIETCTEARR